MEENKSLKEHIELLLIQDYPEFELYARLCALLALWNRDSAS